MLILILSQADRTVHDLCYLTVCLLYTWNLFPGQRKMSLPPHSLCNFSPLGTDAINVPAIVQDVPLHKRFPCCCCPVISFLVHNIMWLLHLRGPTMSRVSTHPHNQAVMFSNTQSCFHWWCEVKRAFCAAAPGVTWIFQVKRDSASRHV